jgi:hypothetical protein
VDPEAFEPFGKGRGTEFTIRDHPDGETRQGGVRGESRQHWSQQGFLIVKRGTASFREEEPEDGNRATIEGQGTQKQIEMDAQTRPFRPVNDQRECRTFSQKRG